MADAPDLPKRYAVGRVYRVLRVCERMGLRPAEFDALPFGEQAALLAYAGVREAEEARAREMAK